MFREQTRRARGRSKKRRPLFTCGSCGKGYSNPFGHQCSGGGGLKRKRAAAERQAERDKRRAREREIRAAERKRAQERVNTTRAKERQRARERVAVARAKAKAPSPTGRSASRPAGRGGRPQHDWALCRDAECERQVCEAYREGVADGRELEHQPAYDEGWMAGRAAAGTGGAS